MRRLLLVPALALVLLGTPVLALQDPEPPPTTTTTIPLTSDSSPDTSPDTTPETTSPPATEAPAPPDAETATPGWESEATPIDATLVGVTWDGDPAAVFVVEVQSTDGSWSENVLGAADTGADAGTPDAARAEAFPDNATEPLWVGDDATAVRVTLEEGVASDVEVAAIESEPAPAPDGAAGAITGALGTVDGAGRWVFAAALLVTVAMLVALAFGWRPRRALRCVALVAAALLLAACVPVAPPPPPPPSSPPPGNGSYPPRPGMVGRTTWGARPFACDGGPEYSTLKYAVVHHTVNSNGYGPGESPGIVRAIQNYHLDALGYCDIAYNFLIDRYGTTFVGRDGGAKQAVIGGHAGGFNTGSVGVALIGDFTSVQPPGEQWNALVKLLRWRLSVAHLDPSVPTTIKVGSSPCGCQRWPVGTTVYLDNLIWGHGDLNNTACPGAAFSPRRGALRQAVQAGIKFPH
jgi:hypothetical protein